MVASLKTNIMAVVDGSDARGNRDESLGTILMLEIRAAISVDQRDIADFWAKHDLPAAHLPKPRAAKDAFRKAAPRNKPVNGLSLIEYKGDAKAKHGLSMACVLTSSTDVRDRVSLVHRNRAVVGLDTNGEFVAIELTPFGLSDEERAYIEGVRERFVQIQNRIDGEQIRSAVNRILREGSAVWIHTSTYVVPATRRETAERVVGLLRDLNTMIAASYDENRIVMIDYTDVPEQRRQLRDQIESHVRREIASKFVEIATYQENRKRFGKNAGDKKKESVMGEIAELGTLIVEYETVLRESLAPIRHYLDMQRTLLEKELYA